MRLAASLASERLRVRSAGTEALVGSEMEPRVAQHLVDLGIDSHGFRARQLKPELVSGADLILCATREHRSLAVRMEPSSLRRTYALADFSDICSRIIQLGYPGLRDDVAPQNKADGLASLVEAATRTRGEVPARTTEQAEIVDPFRRADKILDAMIEQVEHLLPPVAAVLNAVTPPSRVEG